MGAGRARGHVEVVQLHGFGEDVRRDQPEVWAVVSNGDPQGESARVAEVTDALRRAFGAPFARYPEEAADLGGTTNVIGHRVRAEPSAGFLHLELSAEFRDELERRPNGPSRLAAALGSVASQSEAARAP